MKAVNVTTSETEVAPVGVGREWLCVQNDSDIDMYIKFDGSATAVTSALGIRIGVGQSYMLEGPAAKNAVTAIHAGVGNKVMKVQNSE